MSTNWIKMRVNLDSNPHVLELSALLSIPELHVVGCLWKVWAWADTHSIDGNGIRVTNVTLDRFTGVTGFAEALRKVGWLEGHDHELSFPRFAEHNGQTAKNRAKTAERVAKHRNAKTVTDVTPKSLPDKIREDKNSNELSKDNSLGAEPPKPRKRFIPPTLEEVAEFCRNRNNGIDPEAFIASYESKGWLVGETKTPMKNWRAAVVTWEKKKKERSNGRIKPGSTIAEHGERGL